jgi:hypothetical protein
VSFEQAFVDTEKAAEGAVRAVAALSSAVKSLHRAAQHGDLVQIERLRERLASACDTAAREVANASAAWPLSTEVEGAYLREQFADELERQARADGLHLHRQDEALIATPSVLRILPEERAVRIGRKRIYSLRPSRLIALLKEIQARKPRANSQRFLEALYSAYLLVGGDSATGKTVRLAEIYRAFTLLPGLASEYEKDDFSRDLFALDHSGINQTRSGARATLPASTGTKAPRDTFVCAAPDGQLITYYAVKFSLDQP